MRTLKLLWVFFKINVQMSLAYRTDALVQILVNLLWLGWELLGLSIIFNNTSALSGWAPGDMVVLLGVFRAVNMFMAVLVWPNTERFNLAVRDGTLDYTLLQPVNSLYLVTFSRMTIWRVSDAVVALALIIGGMSMGGSFAAIYGIGFLVLLTSGTLILYSLWVVMIAVTFWFVKFDNNVTILQALLDAGRYPVSVYPTWLQVIITFVVPIAVATTVPVQALRGELTFPQMLLYLAISTAAFLAAKRFWQAGVWKYSGASS